MIMKKFIYILAALLLIVSLAGCGNDLEVEAEIKYSVYENDGADKVSFYLTSDIEKDGKWQYTLDGLTNLAVFETNTQTAEDIAEYTTIILKPVGEGEETLSFTLNDGRICEYLVKVKKDNAGILRITVTSTKTDMSAG